jgi:hypothetical protein
MSTIRSAVVRGDTIVRLGGDGGSGFLTWTSDDRQLATLLDGSSWPRDQGPFWHSRVFALHGRPEAMEAEELESYPEMPIYPDLYSNITPPYYGLTLLAVGDTIYQYLSTSTIKPFDAEVRVVPGMHLNAAKLIYSPDNGRTWQNQDGSSPVVREVVGEQRPDRMVFLEETNSAFSLLSFLQMGRAYRENRDGFAYVYSPNGYVDGRMNELVMFRVPTSRILDRDSYEFFAGRSKSREPGWTPDIKGRVPVHVFPSGRMPEHFNISWLPTVGYIPALGGYLMIAGSAPGDVGIKPKDIGPGYLGMWVSESPWGPWTQIFEDEAWTPGADTGARASAPAIAPAWIAADGLSLWFIWMDTQLAADGPGEDELLAAMRTTDMSLAVPGRREWGRCHPGYCVNAQRIDLTVS